MPLLVMPDGVRAAGFVPPGIEVNQVFGSFTGVRDGRRVIQVPAGLAGPFRLVSPPPADGKYSSPSSAGPATGPSTGASGAAGRGRASAAAARSCSASASSSGPTRGPRGWSTAGSARSGSGWAACRRPSCCRRSSSPRPSSVSPEALLRPGDVDPVPVGRRRVLEEVVAPPAIDADGTVARGARGQLVEQRGGFRQRRPR